LTPSPPFLLFRLVFNSSISFCVSPSKCYGQGWLQAINTGFTERQDISPKMHWEHPPTHCSSSVGFIMFEFVHNFLTHTFKGNKIARHHSTQISMAPQMELCLS
jgi:hypothetical protein